MASKTSGRSGVVALLSRLTRCISGSILTFCLDSGRGSGDSEKRRLPSAPTVRPNGARHEDHVLPISVYFSRLVGVESPKTSRTLGWVLQEKVGQRRYQLSRSRG